MSGCSAYPFEIYLRRWGVQVTRSVDFVSIESMLLSDDRLDAVGEDKGEAPNRLAMIYIVCVCEGVCVVCVLSSRNRQEETEKGGGGGSGERKEALNHAAAAVLLPNKGTFPI